MMPHPGGIPINPPPRPLPPITYPQPEYYAPPKRRRDEYDGAAAPGFCELEGPAPPKRLKTRDVIFRIVVPSMQIGKVIGKVGCRIQKIREETKATIKIADAIARHEERVIIISSKESDNSVSDAENALKKIAALILKDDDSPAEVGAGHVAANAIRILIAGSLIGISAQNIEKLTGASITVSAHESDRVVQISGHISIVLKAVEEIGCQRSGT